MFDVSLERFSVFIAQEKLKYKQKVAMQGWFSVGASLSGSLSGHLFHSQNFLRPWKSSSIQFAKYYRRQIFPLYGIHIWTQYINGNQWIDPA